jgi:hypothetical protein
MTFPPCSATTRRGRPCPFPGDRDRGGRTYCHVHDPLGQFRRNVETKRKAAGKDAIDQLERRGCA